jgi:hypothetical protein
VEKLKEKVCNELEEISDSLRGLSGLFIISGSEVFLDVDELNGIGQILKKLSTDLKEVKESLKG